MSQETPTTPEPLLTPLEARVLGCLMEKQRTTPDNYPLTLNALVTACNQKTSRDPVMSLTAGEVGHAANVLRDRGLVRSTFSGRSERFEHRLNTAFELTQAMQALLCVLMLRGPQTPGELRGHAGRMAEFSDLEEIQHLLESLARRDPPMVTRLPRLPGMREERYAHLLCGEVDVAQLKARTVPAGQVGGDRADERIAALEAEVAVLREELERLWRLTGLSERREG